MASDYKVFWKDDGLSGGRKILYRLSNLRLAQICTKDGKSFWELTDKGKKLASENNLVVKGDTLEDLIRFYRELMLMAETDSP